MIVNFERYGVFYCIGCVLKNANEVFRMKIAYMHDYAEYLSSFRDKFLPDV